ncbi:hypothetical protein [Lysinibacillus sp. NPDC047702]|uniref:hypothetical protein n=1 Tax=unclassified Lysinibacillus TaxID=2636778 RepID=UPI003D056D24
MKISSLIEHERISTSNRKKVLQRKEAGDAYRKNALYFQPKKNPLLQELESLLLGQKDLDLFEQQKEESQEVTPQQQAIFQEMEQTKKSVLAHEQANKMGNSEGYESISFSQLSEVEDVVGMNPEKTLQVLEQVRNAALSPAQPSTQDLRIAESANAQIQQIQAQLQGQEFNQNVITDSEPAYLSEVIEVKVPERFTKELILDPFADTIFGKSYGEGFKAGTFKHASEKYATHIQMAKNGYRLGNEATFSMIA